MDYFRSNKDLRYGDFRDLAQMIAYREYEADTFVYKKGDEPENFYIVLNGQLAEEERNQIIDSWDWAMSIYKGLLEWKKKEFSPKLSKAIMIANLKNNFKTNTIQLMKLGVQKKE